MLPWCRDDSHQSLAGALSCSGTAAAHVSQHLFRCCLTADVLRIQSLQSPARGGRASSRRSTGAVPGSPSASARCDVPHYALYLTLSGSKQLAPVGPHPPLQQRPGFSSEQVTPGELSSSFPLYHCPWEGAGSFLNIPCPCNPLGTIPSFHWEPSSFHICVNVPPSRGLFSAQAEGPRVGPWSLLHLISSPLYFSLASLRHASVSAAAETSSSSSVLLSITTEAWLLSGGPPSSISVSPSAGLSCQRCTRCLGPAVPAS